MFSLDVDLDACFDHVNYQRMHSIAVELADDTHKYTIKAN
jgi:hypothetical protein